MNWRNNFLDQRGDKTIADLKQELKMKQVDDALSKTLRDQNEKMRREKINKEIQKLLAR